MLYVNLSSMQICYICKSSRKSVCGKSTRFHSARRGMYVSLLWNNGVQCRFGCETPSRMCNEKWRWV